MGCDNECMYHAQEVVAGTEAVHAADYRGQNVIEIDVLHHMTAE